MKSSGGDFKEVRGRYLLSSFEILDTIAALLQNQTLTNEQLNELRELLQKLSFGGRYGYEEVTELTLQWQYECDGLIRENRPADTPLLNRWKNLLETLWIEYAKGPGTGKDSDSVPEQSFRPYEVLVVDDDKLISSMVTDLLEREGMLVFSVRTCGEAVNALSERHPDAVVTDILLPDGLGYELLEHIQSLPEEETPVVVVLSVLTGFLDKVQAIHLGADCYFEKPVDWEAFLERLVHLLETKQNPNARILCLQDDPTETYYIQTLLELAGYSVKTCDDPKKLEEKLASFNPEILILDLLFSRLSGYDLVRFLRQDPRYAFLPVLFLTSSEQARNAKITAAKSGADGYLIKPVVPGLLLAIVNSNVERFRFLKSQINRDGLTRFLAEKSFLQQAQAIIGKKRRKDTLPATLTIIDIDHFQSINDKYGYPMGDRVLVTLSSFLRRRIRQSDLKGRLGPHLCIIIDNLCEEETVQLMQKLHDEFSHIPHQAPDSSSFPVTFTVGFSLLDPEKMSVDSWKQTAEHSLHQAKAARRGLSSSAGSAVI